MKKRMIVALLATLAALVGAVVAAPAQAAKPEPTKHSVKYTLGTNGKFSKTVDGKAVPMVASSVNDYRYTGHKFGGQWICQWDGTGPNTPVAATGDAFEAGTNPVNTVVLSYRSASQNCTGYTDAQRVYFREYQSADNSCGEISGPLVTVADPQNPYYTDVWAGTVVVSVNTYYLDCRETAQRRANVVSRLTGKALGLAEWYNTSTAAIMNTYWGWTYSYAGTFDRNNLYYLY